MTDLKTKVDTTIGDTFMVENATVIHQGHEFTAGGALISGDLIVGYPDIGDRDTRRGDVGNLSTWDGAPIMAIRMTGWQYGFHRSIVYRFASVVPFNGRYWHGQSGGNGMMTRMRPGRAAAVPTPKP